MKPVRMKPHFNKTDNDMLYRRLEAGTSLY